MSDAIVENNLIANLLGIIKTLERSVGMMEKAIPKPRFIDEPERERWRFEKPNAVILQVLMCVRITSALRACIILLGSGHTTEIGVLFRTIDDFLADITFADEVIEKGIGNATAGQREWLENYFVDENRTTDEMLADSTDPVRKANYLKRRQKVQASQARMLGGDNPYRVKKIVKTLDDSWSGVVHGNYQSVMEMYGGDSLEDSRFRMEGMPTRRTVYRHFIGLLVHNALNEFSKVAFNLGLNELANELRELRKEFEKSPSYTSR